MIEKSNQMGVPVIDIDGAFVVGFDKGRLSQLIGLVEIYKVGGMMPENGFYVCIPCGDKKYLKAGTRFKSCLKCLGKEWRLFKKGLELWERIYEPR